MKRSEINQAIRTAREMMQAHGFRLPPFADYAPQAWQAAERAAEAEILAARLGWDVTDFNLGDFARKGLTLFTLRNQTATNGKPYAEKILVVGEGQLTPLHYHWHKMEDIINRGGGNLIFRLYNATKDGQLADTDVEINQDGRKYMVKAGSDIVLKPGESLTLYPYYYHEFVVQPGTGTVLLGEVSMCNDDNTDNRFLEPLGRFPTIEEDEPPYRLLCTEYSPAK